MVITLQGSIPALIRQWKDRSTLTRDCRRNSRSIAVFLI